MDRFGRAHGPRGERGGAPTAHSCGRAWVKTVVGPDLDRGKMTIRYCVMVYNHEDCRRPPGQLSRQSGLQAELPAIALPGPLGSERCEGV